MKKTEEAFLNLLRAALQEEAPDDPELNPEEWEALLLLSESHKLLPLILDEACGLPSCRAALASDKQKNDQFTQEQKSPRTHRPWKELALEQFCRQALQENEFLNLMLALRERGLEPVVMKGAVCRALYPKPLLRSSLDDDLMIPEDQVQAYHAALLELGLTADEPDFDPASAWELPYHKQGSPLFVELHKKLFDPTSPVFGGFNLPFEGALDRSVPITVQDVTLRTLAPTDHLLFLILHAFKHFLLSGFGMRIVADVCLYSRQNAGQIDFQRLLSLCEAQSCQLFASAVYRIGEKYLGLPMPEPFAALQVDENELLLDVLDSGLHGEEVDRLHSANITLGAAAAGKTGKPRTGSLRKTLFPSAGKLKNSYPFLAKRPWLLPYAWACRIGAYWKNNKRYGKQSPTATLRIGRERVKLLKIYGVIDE